MQIYFKDIPRGLFRYKNMVYTKISDTQAVIITSGKIVDFTGEEIVLKY